MSTLAGAAVNRLKLNEFAEPGRQWPYECCKDCWLPTTDDYIAACEARGWEATTGIHFNCVTGNFTPDAYVWTKPGLPIDGHDFHEASGPTARAALEAAILSALEDV